MEVPLLVWIALVLFGLLPLMVRSEEIKNCKPAAIIKQPKRTVFFQKNATLDCVAKGDPTLKYTWLKDGQKFDLDTADRIDRIAFTPGVGSLVFSPAVKEDAGVYQCRVHNPCGTSVSTNTSLRHAEIQPFPKIERPTEVQAFLGRNLTLRCEPPVSVPDATISWILESEEEEYDEYHYGEEDDNDEMFERVKLGRRITMDYSGNLYFVSVEKEDATEGRIYVCMALNHILRSINQGQDKVIKTNGDTVFTDPARLQWNSPKHELVLEGGKVRFKCIFSGNPTPEVTWHRIDNGVLDEERMVQSDDKHEFVISDVHPEDAGEYSCKGTNALVREPIRQTFTLSVESMPRWTKRPKDMVVGVGDNVTVVCSADANPKATVEWYINGDPLHEAPYAKNRRLVKNALVFSSVTQDDTQVIQCKASNAHGYLWADVFLQVEALPPTIVSMLTEQKVAKEQSVTIPCQVEGKPRPQVLWYKGRQQLLGDRYQVLPSGDLHFQSVNERDTGAYRCIAKNRFGEARAQGSLIVRDKTVIVTPPTDDQVSEGQTAIFTCGAITAIEELIRLKYVWLKDGVPIDTKDPRVEVKEGSLQISDITSEDTGNYTCQASNSLDSDHASAMLQVIAPPDPPTGVTIWNCKDMKVSLEWEFHDSQSNFSPLQEFMVEYSTDHDPDVWQEAMMVPADQRVATYNMSPWATYTFRVRARSRMGISEPSQPTVTTCMSAEARPYSNPQNVRTVEDKTGWLVIEWEPMTRMEHNSEGFHYLVTWQPQAPDDQEGAAQSVRVDDWRQDRLETEVGGVYQPYAITVEAANRLGKAVAPAVEIMGHSGEAAPSVVPQNFELDPNENVSATSAAFRWDPVDTSPESVNGNFQGYKIRFWKKGQMESTMQEELIIIPDNSQRRRRAVGEKIHARLAGLPAFSQIEADVVVANTHFVSSGSNIVSFATEQGVPSAVKYLEALFRGSSHFLLEWGPPEEANGVMTGYQLGFQKVQGLMVGPVMIAKDDLPVGQQRTTLDGLDPSSLYRVFVAGKTAMGPGKRYFIDVRTTDDTSELAEPKIESVVAGDKKANITFTLAEGQKGERTGSVYYLEYRKMGEHGWDREKDGATDHFWLTLKDLEPATTYEVRVVSVPKSADSESAGFKPSAETRFDTSGIGAKKGSFLSAAWFIGMMVAIALLLLILIVVCIVKRNRGKAYTFPPEKDTVDGSAALFNEPPKNAKNGVNSGVPKGPEGEKIPLGDETDSLAEYGDDPIRFNEDGSFIGQYGENKQPPPDPSHPSTMPHIV